MNRYIVITSIFEPTEAVVAFSKNENYKVIVVGDKKTPVNWELDQVDYISPEKQIDSKFKLAGLLPYNHYCRKMVGYLFAIESGAEFIIDTDDDNIPKTGWDFPVTHSNYSCISNIEGFVNIYQLFTDQKIWPRGLPLDLINKDFNLKSYISTKKCKVGVWQGLADEDPDVDAVYRLTDNTPCYFKESDPVVLESGVICPFNSQNTLITKDLFALLYLPTFVTFRFTDILRGLVAQPIMWLYDYQLGFTKATVVQKRNPHDYMKDFESEIPMYQYCSSVPELVSKSISASASISDNLFNAYKQLESKGVVTPREIETLEAWLFDLQNILS